MYHPFLAKDQNRIQISLLDKLQKLKISLKVIQMTQNDKITLESLKAQSWGIHIRLGHILFFLIPLIKFYTFTSNLNAVTVLIKS
jgi:hypothetical protein